MKLELAYLNVLVLKASFQLNVLCADKRLSQAAEYYKIICNN